MTSVGVIHNINAALDRACARTNALVAEKNDLV